MPTAVTNTFLDVPKSSFGEHKLLAIKSPDAHRTPADSVVRYFGFVNIGQKITGCKSHIDLFVGVRYFGFCKYRP